MKRKVIGYEKTLEYLKKGYEIIAQPINENKFIYIEENNEYITVRYDSFGKLMMNDLIQYRKKDWNKLYSLKEAK